MATLANTTSYLHALKIIHRDIRADNILYKDADPESIMYLGYFDLATPVPEGSAGVKGEVGAIANAAPEILRRQAYSYPADCWSLGIIAYQLLCGTHPFVSGKGTLGETFDAILAADPPFEGAVWALVSPEGKEFVKRLLDPNPATRMTAEEVFDSEVSFLELVGDKRGKSEIDVLSCFISGFNSTRLELIWNGSRASPRGTRTWTGTKKGLASVLKKSDWKAKKRRRSLVSEAA